MKTIAAWVLGAAVLAVSAASDAGGIELVRGGQAVATIVVPDNAPAPERLAATELQAIIEKVSGAPLSIAAKAPAGDGPLVFVGQAAAREAGDAVLAAAQLDQLRDDGYSAKLAVQQRPALVLAGGLPRSSLYAVYDLLETELECGFFVDGDQLPRRSDIVLGMVNLAANPAFADRTVAVPLSVYGPKRFQATLWNAEDWKAFLRWMAKRKMNRLALPFTAAGRAWGTAFDKAFPEAKAKRQEVLGNDGPITARMGYGLAPEHTTAVLKEAIDYARNTLGLEVAYVFAFGEFEQALQQAMPNLKWKPAYPPTYPAVAGGSCALSAADPACRDLQAKLWKAIIETYGPANQYVVACQAPPNAVVNPGPAENATTMAIETLKSVDPGAKVFCPTWEDALWGATPEAKTGYLRQLPEGATILYADAEFGQDLFAKAELPLTSLYSRTRRFADRPFVFCCQWGGGPANDLFENRLGVLRNLFRHVQFTEPKPRATGVWNWNEARRVNPQMDDLMAEFAWKASYVWRGEGANTNRVVHRYLARRYTPDAVFPMAEAQKEALRGAPRAEADVNYRAYVRWTSLPLPSTAAARTALALALACKKAASPSPFYEPDLADLGRNYLHETIQETCNQIVAAVRDAKQAAGAKKYDDQAKKDAAARLQQAETRVLAAHKALTRLVATRKDMCLDDAILEAAATKGANKLLAQAIREQQSSLFANGYALTDTLEYHQQLCGKQLQALLDYAKGQLNAPTADAMPGWETFFRQGAAEYVEKSQPAAYDTKAEKTPPSTILQEFLEKAD